MQSELWRVGEYQVSGAANTICLEGADPVKLPPRLIDTLLYFARHAGEVISRKELVENVWNRSVVPQLPEPHDSRSRSNRILIITTEKT